MDKNEYFYKDPNRQKHTKLRETDLVGILGAGWMSFETNRYSWLCEAGETNKDRIKLLALASSLCDLNSRFTKHKEEAERIFYEGYSYPQFSLEDFKRLNCTYIPNGARIYRKSPVDMRKVFLGYRYTPYFMHSGIFHVPKPRTNTQELLPVFASIESVPELTAGKIKTPDDFIHEVYKAYDKATMSLSLWEAVRNVCVSITTEKPERKKRGLRKL
jgi:hypothetical protein